MTTKVKVKRETNWAKWKKANPTYSTSARRGGSRQNIVKGSFRNILKTYEESTQEQRDKGLAFYEDARSQAYEIGKQLGYIGSNAVRQGAGIIAVLSPRMDWDKNLEIAFYVVNALNFSNQTERDKAKATRIMEGENPMLVMGRDSHKTKSFYQAMVNPLGNNEVYNLTGYGDKVTYLAVVDRHAGGVYKGMPLKEYQREQIGHWRVNRRISRGYFKAAKQLDMPVNDVQAITWVTFRDSWKGKKPYGKYTNIKSKIVSSNKRFLKASKVK